MRITATPDSVTGSVIISGTEMPQTLATVYRYNPDGTTTILRGAQNIAITNGILFAEDSEASYATPLHYVVLLNIGDRVVQRNLITNPSIETNTTSWTAGAFRSIARTTYPSTDAAYAGTQALFVGERTPQGGDSTTVPFEAPLARVDAPFVTSTTSRPYEFSFRTRLDNSAASYFTDAVIITGTTDVSWQTAYDQYSSWALPYGQNLSWAALETSTIAVPPQIDTVATDPVTSDWVTAGATWDGTTSQLTLSPALRARNYVINPTIATATTGYSASVTSGTVPVLSLFTFPDATTALRAIVSASSVDPTVTFNASGLTIGTEYQARIDAILPAGQSITMHARNYTVSSAGTLSDGTSDWITESVIFTAAATTETINLRFLPVAGTVYLDQTGLSLPEVDYFDGSKPDSIEFFYNWVGATNASASERNPYGTIYSPTDSGGNEFEAAWDVTTLDGGTLEVVAGIVDVDGLELITPIRAFITAPAGTVVTPASFGVSAGTGNANGIILPVVDTTAWAEGWRVYIRVGAPGAHLVYRARTRTFNQPSYIPLTLGVRARLLLPNGTTLFTSELLAYATVTEWREARWSFTLPATVVGTYKFEIVPEVLFTSAAASWQLDAAMLEPNPPHQEGRLTYLDGSMPVPATPIPGYFATVGDFDSASNDAIIRWVVGGTAHASASEFLGPSLVTLTIETILPLPDADPDALPDCEPINLTDPTVPELGAWFTLQTISSMSYAARSASYIVVNRRAPIVISQNRSTAEGSMVLLLRTLNERNSLLDLVASGRVLLLRNPNPLYPEDHLYLSIGTVAEERIAPDHRLPYRRFTLEFQVVDRPGGLIAATQPPTWADVVATYSAWGTVLDPNSVLANVHSWTDLIRKAPAIVTPFSMPRSIGAYSGQDTN